MKGLILESRLNEVLLIGNYNILITSVLCLGNILVVTVVLMDRTMHTATNALILNQSVSDILYVSFTVPVSLSMEICNNRWLFGESVGKMSQQIIVVSGASSIFTVIAIGYERY